MIPFLPGRKVGHVVDPISGCWNWTGSHSHNGYPQVGLNNKVVYAHRAMYERIVGTIPVGLDLDHLCRNRSCVNPAPVEPVTRRENVRRGATIKLTDAQVAEIRRRASPNRHARRGERVAMAREYGISLVHLWKIVVGQQRHEGSAI